MNLVFTMETTTITRTNTRAGRGLDVPRWVAWFLIGAAVAIALQVLQVRAVGGGWAGLLAVSADSPLRPVIEGELGEVVLVADGHDGQTSFVMALDPDGSEHADLLVDAGYRWRRILYPFLAGGGGLLRGEALLASLALWAAAGMGLATAAVVDLGALLGLRRWVAGAVLANLGVWFSVQLVTPDALALGLSLAGVTAYLRGKLPLAVVLLAAAALAKDHYLLFALGLAAHAAWRRSGREVAWLAGGSAAPLAMWAVWVEVTIGGGVSAEGNLAWPGAGIVRGARLWGEFPTSEVVLSSLAVALVVLAIAAGFVARPLVVRFLLWPWVITAVVLSHWVWKTGNNTLRVLLPLWLFTWIAMVALVDRDHSVDATEPVSAGTARDRRSGT